MTNGERMNAKKMLFTMTAASLLWTAPSHAIDFKNRLSVGGSYGVTDPRMPGSFADDYDQGRGFTGYMGYGLVNNLSLVASYSDLWVAEAGATDRTLRVRPILLSLRANLAPRWVLNPYVIAGAGMSLNNRQMATGPNVTWEKFAARGGVGAEIFLTPSTSIGGEALYHHITSENGGRDYGIVTYAGTVNVYFGEAKQTKEAREAAAAARREADAARAQAAAAAQESATAQAQTNAAQAAAAGALAQANNAQTESMTAQQKAAAAEAAAAAALASKTEAERRASEMQGQASAAQGELDRIKDMIAKKEMQPVQFATGSSQLLNASDTVLTAVADAIKKYPNLKLRVEGHTDSQGSDTTNLKLSQRRADAVKAALVEKGIPSEQLNAAGFGETRPIDSNDTAEGRANNRRVEFMVFL